MKNSNKLAKITLVSVSALLVIGATLFTLEKTGIINLYSSPNANTNTKGPTSQQNAQNEKINADAKQQFLDNISKDKADVPAPSPANNPTLSIAATQAGTSVTVLTKIQSVAEGTCKLVVTNGTKTSTQEAKVIYQPEFSSCAGFSVPISGLGGGTWDITLSVNPTSGSAITKITTLDVK